MEHPTYYRTIQIDGLSIFYREAGPKDAPTLLLLHGLPSSSRMFEPLFARLSESLSPRRARLPGLRTQRLAGPEEVRVHVRPLRRDHESLHRSARALALHPLHAGLRRAGGVSHGPCSSGSDRGAHRPGRCGAQRRPGSELEDAAGLLGRSRGQRSALRTNLLSLATTRTRHVGNDPNVERYDPDLWTDEFDFLSQPGQADIQSDLFYDYRTNVEAYPSGRRGCARSSPGCW